MNQHATATLTRIISQNEVFACSRAPSIPIYLAGRFMSEKSPKGLNELAVMLLNPSIVFEQIRTNPAAGEEHLHDKDMKDYICALHHWPRMRRPFIFHPTIPVTELMIPNPSSLFEEYLPYLSRQKWL